MVGSDILAYGGGVTLEEESARATELLHGKVVRRIIRHRESEVLIEFEDGSRLFADSETPLELSMQRPE